LLRQSQGDSTAALTALQQAEAVSPGDPEIPFARATILVRLGRLDEARLAANKSLEMDPGFDRAKKLLEMISAR
jgi:Flp pilus assembly protein TadD